MQRSGAATRRFYAAFYHWTLRSANPTNRRCAGTTSTLVPRRKQSSAHGARGTPHSSARAQRHKESVGTTEQLRREPVQSVAERPTDSLELWDFAVREKTENSVKVELLVPQRVLRVRDVAKRAMIHEVKLHTPLFREDVGDDGPCAIILEGDYTDVKAVWKNIYYHGAGQSTNGSTTAKEATYANVEPIAHRLRQDFAREHQQTFVEKECSLPDPFWQPIGRTGTVEYLQTQFGLQVDMLGESGPLQYAILKGSERQIREVDKFLEGIRVQELERAHRKNSIDAVEKQVKIIRRNDLPSENLEAWQSVTRKQLEGRIEIDFCLPERVWQEITRNGGAENLQARFAMEFEPMDVSQSGETRCITLKGDVVHADRAKSYLEGFQVTLPELQEDREYLKLHSAATGLHMINDRGQRQLIRKIGEKDDNDKQVAQVASKTPKKKLTSLPPKEESTHDVQLSDELRGAKEEDIDKAASQNSHKRLAIISPEEPPAQDDVMDRLHNTRRLDVPEHIRQELEASNDSTLERIRHDSGLEAILCLQTGTSRKYLKTVGSKHACQEARVLLQRSIDDDNERTGRSNPGIDELALSIDADFTPPEATHIAWIQMPYSVFLSRRSRVNLRYKTDAYVRTPGNVDGKQILSITGPAAPVKVAVAEIQTFVQEARKATDNSSSEFEILKTGLVADVGADPPVELSTKLAEPETETSVTSVNKLYAPEAKPHQTHFAFLKLANTIAYPVNREKRKLVAEKRDCFIGGYGRVNDAEGMIRIFGAEDAVSNAISDLQEVIDDSRKVEGEPPAKIEIIGMGLCSDMPDPKAVKVKLNGAAAVERRERALASIGKTAAASSQNAHVQRRHFAWIKLILAESSANSMRSMFLEIAHRYRCKMSNPPTRAVDGIVQGGVRILGNENAVKSVIEVMQQLMATETQKNSGTSAVGIEIMQMGLQQDMGDFRAFLRSVQAGAPVISMEQRASLLQQIPTEDGVAEQARRAASSSVDGKTSEGSKVASASDADAKEAEGQPTQQSNQQLSDNMRSALRHITQPVALVTSFMPPVGFIKEADKRALIRGVTVSSFCTVTLHPIPVVSFNLRVPSRSWDAISASGFLRVHLLKASPEGATAAHAFTLPYEQSHEPFRHVAQKGGLTNYPQSKNPAKVPRIAWREAIHADFVAKIMREKCIEVGDHMIIVAKVTAMSSKDADATDTGALAYGMKGYRQLGGEIKPMELKLAEPRSSEAMTAKEDDTVENVPGQILKNTERMPLVDQAKSDEKAIDEVDSVANVADNVVKPAEQESTSSAVESHEEARDEVARNDEVDLYELFAVDEDDFEATPAPAPKNMEDLGPSSPMLDEESLRQVLEENDAAYSSLGLPSQTAANNPMLAQALSAVSGAYSDASAPDESSQPERSHTQTPSADHTADTTTPSQSESESQKQPSVDHPADSTVLSQPESASQTENLSAERPSSSTTRQDRPTNALSSGKRPWGMDDTMTQQIRKLSIYHSSPSNNRHHYSTTSNSNHESPSLSKKLLKTTVADYLCQIPTHRKRYTNLIKLQRSAEAFEAQLQNPNASMTEEEAATLSSQAQIARRKVSRELALRNAQDLRAMLDKGRVQSSAVQWLETNLEHGQVVLLDEAKVLRRELEDGKLRVEEFEKAKAELTRDYEAIDAQLMRLRDFVEEDYGVDMDDDGESAEEEERRRGQ